MGKPFYLRSKQPRTILLRFIPLLESILAIARDSFLLLHTGGPVLARVVDGASTAVVCLALLHVGRVHDELGHVAHASTGGPCHHPAHGEAGDAAGEVGVHANAGRHRVFLA